MEKGDKKWEQAIGVLNKGGLVVLPTDTIYGIVARANDEKAVNHLYLERGRNRGKPCIILASGVGDLQKLGVELSGEDKKILGRIWPNQVSVILPCPSPQMFYLHRGTKTLAVRIPKDERLRKFLKQTGPLVAPSANPEGMPPARTLEEARDYFGDKVGAYVEGEVYDQPSTLIKLENGQIHIIRNGAWKVPASLFPSVQ